MSRVLQAEFRSIIFALCYFHAALLERKKFGVGNLPSATSGIGWNMNYPFNTGDLLCCGQCASNYLENNVKVRNCRVLLGSGAVHSQLAASYLRRTIMCFRTLNHCMACWTPELHHQVVWHKESLTGLLGMQGSSPVPNRAAGCSREAPSHSLSFCCPRCLGTTCGTSLGRSCMEATL